MNAAQALARVKKILGPKADVRVRNSVPVGEARLTEIAQRRALGEELKALQAARDARRDEVLKADAEYQRLRAQAQEVEKKRDGLCAGHDFRVVVVADCCIKGQGDNFDEAIASLKQP